MEATTDKRQERNRISGDGKQLDELLVTEEVETRKLVTGIFQKETERREDLFLKNTINSNRIDRNWNHNLKISRAPLKCQVHQLIHDLYQ